MTVVYVKRLNLPQSVLFRPSRGFLSRAGRELLRYAAKMEYGVDTSDFVEEKVETKEKVKKEVKPASKTRKAKTTKTADTKSAAKKAK